MPVSNTTPFVDIHCHLLPEIDDGAADWAESLAMARMAAADGIATVIATPHQLGNHADNHSPLVRQKCSQLQDLLDRQRVAIRVLPGADVRIEPGLIGKIRAGEVLTLADRRRHVLLELPHELYLPLEGLLEELDSAGVSGILSHPERNLGILQRPGIASSLVEAGCLMQVTAGSLVGAFGARIQRFSEELIKQGLVHFIATDAHGSKSRRPLVRRSFDRVAELAGDHAALELCSENPARVAAGECVPAGRRRWRAPRKRAATEGGSAKRGRRGLRGLAGWFRKRRAA